MLYGVPSTSPTKNARAGASSTFTSKRGSCSCAALIVGMATHSATRHTAMRMKLVHRRTGIEAGCSRARALDRRARSGRRRRESLRSARRRRDRPRARSCRSRSRGRARRNAAPLRRARLPCDGSPLGLGACGGRVGSTSRSAGGLRAHRQQQRCEIRVVQCFHGRVASSRRRSSPCRGSAC